MSGKNIFQKLYHLIKRGLRKRKRICFEEVREDMEYLTSDPFKGFSPEAKKEPKGPPSEAECAKLEKRLAAIKERHATERANSRPQAEDYEFLLD